jgi:hypothetical protein
MAGDKGIRAGRAYVELFADNSELVRGLKDAEKSLKAFGASIASVGAKAAGLGAAVVTPLVGAAKMFADFGSDMLDMSQRTGISVEALSELGFAAEQSGADMESLELSVRKMQKFLADAASGGKGAQDMLRSLGLSIYQIAQLAPDEQFERIADRLSQIQNPTMRAAAAMQVFGKSGTKMLPMLANGAAGIAELRRTSRELGLSMSTADATAAEGFGDRIDALGKVLNRVVMVVGSALVPVLDDAARWMTAITVQAAQWIRDNRELIATGFKVAAAVLAGGVALVALGAAIGGIGSILGAVAAGLTLMGSIVAAMLSPVVVVTAAVAALGAWFVTSTQAGGQALEWLGTKFDELKATAVQAWKGIGDAMAAGDMLLAARILWLTLRIEWVKGINFLKGLWIDFSFFLQDVFARASNAIAGVFIDLGAKFQEVWANLFDVGDLGAKLNQIETDRQNAQASLKDQAAAGSAERGAARGASLAGLDAALAQARAEWQTAIDQAAAERGAKEAGDFGDIGQLGKKAWRFGEVSPFELDTALEEAKRKVEVSGTFNAAAVRGLGATSLQDRTMKASEQTAANTRRLVEAANQGGLIFDP